MKYSTLTATMVEAERFLSRAKRLRNVMNAVGENNTSNDCLHHPIEQGAVQRASMDLTRALADLRAGR